MTEISTAIWMIQLLFLSAGAAVLEDGFSEKDLEDTTYECDMNIDGDHWNMQCESGNLGKTAKFYTIRLKGMFQPPASFRLILNNSSISDIYSCDNSIKPIIQIDPSFVKEHCVNFSEHAKLIIDSLKESFITRITITNTSDFATNILQNCSGLNEVTIFNSSLQNFPVSDLQFHPNNTISALTLKQNQFKTINNGAFRKFPALKTLDLSWNCITQVNKSSFDGLKTVETLDLSFNLIETLANDTFYDMILLENVYLQNNNLKYINEGIFQLNHLLHVADISNNDLKLLPLKIFHSLSELTNISCSNCSLIGLDEDIFKKSPKLENIILSHNYIQVLPDEIFKNQRFLTYVNLGYNSISKISRRMFQEHSYLRFVVLTANQIGYLEKGVFDGAPYIYSLDLSKNKLQILTDDDVIGFADLEYFNLELNEIVMVKLGMEARVFIRKIVLSDNLISKLNVNWKRMVYLEDMNLDNNKLNYIDLPPCIPSIKQTITLSVRNNNISRVIMNSLIEDEIRMKTNRSMMAGCFFNGGAKNFVDLTNNSLECDCYLYKFYNYIQRKVPTKYQLEAFINKDNLTCAGPHSLKNKAIIHLENDIFSCLFTKGCSLPCTCGIRGKDNRRFVNCSGNNLYTVAKNITNRSTNVLYFNRNNLSSMESLNVKIWANLIELHIDHNSLNTLDDWNYPESLRYLSVRGNKLKTLPSSLMNFISNQSNFLLFFGDNDKNCSCDSEKLKLFLKERNDFIADTDRIVCKVTNNGTEAFLPLVSVPDSELCPLDSEGLNYKQKRMLISLCLFFTFLIVLLLAYYRHRQLILSFIYIHCDFLYRLLYRDDEFDEEKIFDAFVAYSSSDREIIMNLITELEDHPPYFQLCIHERNWLPGRFICDNILSSVESSKRTIILLSDRFISSPWFNLELRAAVSKMSKDKISRIIFILTEKTVSLSSVDLELQHVISRRTYLVWKERWFWEKLRYAMPRKKPVKDDDISICQPGRRVSGVPLIPHSV